VWSVVCSGPNLDDDDEDIENQPGSHVNGDSQPKTAQQKSGEALLQHILNSDFVDGSSFSFRYDNLRYLFILFIYLIN